MYLIALSVVVVPEVSKNPNVRNYLPKRTALYPKIFESSKILNVTMLRKFWIVSDMCNVDKTYRYALVDTREYFASFVIESQTGYHGDDRRKHGNGRGRLVSLPITL
jgi:hypothetical protein